MSARMRSWLKIGAVAGGILLAYGGAELAQPWLLNLGLTLVGLGVIGFGVEAICTQEDTQAIGETERVQRETYLGFAAMMSGLLMVLLGLAMLAYAVTAWMDVQDAVLAFCAKRPGLALLFGGLVTVSYGFTLLLGAQQDRASALAFLGSLPGRVFGLLLLLVGMGLLFLGAFEIVLPAEFDALIASFAKSLPQLPEY